MKYIYILILVFFSNVAFACDLVNLNIGKKFSDISLGELEKTLITKSKFNNFTKIIIPIEILCENSLRDIIIDVYTFDEKIFKLSFTNSDFQNKNLLKISKDIYKINFNFDKDLKKKFITLQLIKDNKYFFYYLDQIKKFEKFEITEPDLNNNFVNLELDELER